MNYGKFIVLIPIVASLSLVGYSTYNLYILNTGIIEDLNTMPYTGYGDRYNLDLTCHKLGLYTDWDEGLIGTFTTWITDVDAGEHARQLFFENDCSSLCHKYWVSDKICLAELYPRE